MSRRIAVCLALALSVVTASAQFAHDPVFGIAPNSPVPPSGTGGGACGTPQNTLNVSFVGSFVGLVGQMSVTVNIDHTFVADLVITLTHDGVSVVLSDGNNLANGSADLHGAYVFADFAATPIDAASASAGTLVPGSYRPDNPLSAFASTSMAGLWTLQICDRASADVGVLHSVFIDAATQGTQVSDPAVPATIPPSGTGGGACGAPQNTFTHLINVTETGRVGDVAAYFNMTHTYSSDLTITLSHFGVTRTIFSGANGTGGNDFNGFYSFWENRFSLLTGSNAAGGTLTTGFYRSLQDFAPFHGMEMSGPWYLTICDDAGADTGVLSAFELSIARQGFAMNLSQPNGSADVRANDSAGASIGNAYFNAFTLNGGNYPYGWFYGIDIAYSDLLFQINLPIGFFNGTLDGSVRATSTIPGPIPAGLTVYGTAIEIESGALRQVSTPTAHQTVP